MIYRDDALNGPEFSLGVAMTHAEQFAALFMAIRQLVEKDSKEYVLANLGLQNAEDWLIDLGWLFDMEFELFRAKRVDA